MANNITESLLACIPEFDEGCDLPPEEQVVEPTGGGFDKGQLAVLLHGIIAIANVAVPVTMRFLVIEY